MLPSVSAFILHSLGRQAVRARVVFVPEIVSLFNLLLFHPGGVRARSFARTTAALEPRKQSFSPPENKWKKRRGGEEKRREES